MVEACADTLESLSDAERAAARRGGRSDQSADIGRMHDSVMIDPGTPDRNVDVRRSHELSLWLA